MKRILLFCIFSMTLFSVTGWTLDARRLKKDSQGHVLVKLWDSYRKADDEDRPQEKSEILLKIKETARSERLTWDFFDASMKYLSNESSRNWKKRDSLSKVLEAEIDAYGEPILTFQFNVSGLRVNGEELFGYVQQNKEKLTEAHNPEIHFMDRMFEENGIMRFRNDYEYALWALFMRSMFDKELYVQVYDVLRDYVDGEYPLEFLTEYYRSLQLNSDECRTAMDSLAAAYQGRAVALMPDAWLLNRRFRDMPSSSSSEDYMELRDIALSYEKERLSYKKGIECMIAEKVDGFKTLIAILEEKQAAVDVKNGMASVALRNMDRAGFRITEGDKVIYEKAIINDSGNFHRPDTLSFELPVLNDGKYQVLCVDKDGKTLCEKIYSKFTLSLAVRSDSGKIAVFAADHMTGEPVEKAELIITCGKDTLRHEMRFNGFTYLPDMTVGFLKGQGRKTISCSVTGADGVLRKSGPVSGVSPTMIKEGYSRSASVMADRGAYNPGDTVRYKAVVYAVHRDLEKTKTAPEGTEVTVRLRDQNSKVLEERQQKVNRFGSIAGEFVLDDESRNGMRYIEVYRGKIMLGRKAVRVDEFVLPSFDLEFDKTKEFVAPGEKVTVKGTVRSYSGQPVTSYKAKALVRNRSTDKVLKEEDIRLDYDGFFSIDFMSDDAKPSGTANYHVEVTVTDATGETQVFSTSRRVTSYISVYVKIPDEVKGTVTLDDGGSVSVVSGSKVRFACKTSYCGDEVDGQELEYALDKDGNVLRSGKVLSGSDLELDVSGLASGLYHVSFKTPEGSPFEGKTDRRLLKVSDDDKEIAPSVSDLIYVSDDEDIAIRVGSGKGKAWYVVEMMDEKGCRVHSEVVFVESGMKELRYDFKQEYGSCVNVGVLRFFDGRMDNFSHTWHRPVADGPDMTLIFGRFVDKTLPKHRYTFSINGNPDSEMLVAVYDVSSDKINRNVWRVPPRSYHAFDNFYINTNWNAGENGTRGGLYLGPVYVRGYGDEIVTIGYSSSKAKFTGNSVDVEADEAIPFQLVNEEAADLGDVDTREDFASTLAFEPFLMPDSEGNASFEVNTSDKLSTYVVAVFSHDKYMNSSIARREFLVTLPVAISIAEPRYLYEGDRYIMKANVSNSCEEPLEGRLYLEVYDSGDHRDRTPVARYERGISVAQAANASVEFEIDVPAVSEMGFRLVFVGDGYEDAVFKTVPVMPARQSLTEAHSALLLPGTDENSLIGELRSRFVNTSAMGAEYYEKSLAEMFRTMLPEPYVEENRNAVSQSEAMVVNLIASSIKGEESRKEYVKSFVKTVDILSEFVGNDGGISWFEGGITDPFITALVLDRYAGLRDRGLLSQVSEICGEDALSDWDDAVTEAVRYLDRMFFRKPGVEPRIGRIALNQYLYIRSRYAGVPFDEEGLCKGLGKKEFKEKCSEIKDFIWPSKKRSMTEADILGKVQRIRIMMNLPEKDRKIEKSIAKEIVSLKEYAVRHVSGGIYYPNAVLPWRGFIESEAYAHSMICDLFRDLGMEDMADGISLWMMLQKETQKWYSRAGFAEAAASVNDASEAVRNARIAVLSKSYEKPFSEIRPYGNGMKISVRYFREQIPAGSDRPVRVEVKEGEKLNVGDRIYAEYDIWSLENRSYVQAVMPRHACFRPADQLSGFIYGLYGYREVKADRTIYWISLLPEESVKITEELHVVQEGVFNAPAPEIESLYAENYRANGENQISIISE